MKNLGACGEKNIVTCNVGCHFTSIYGFFFCFYLYRIVLKSRESYIYAVCASELNGQVDDMCLANLFEKSAI